MISDYARARLNDPAGIAQRDMWFARLSHVFDSVPDEYNRKYAFTLAGRSYSAPGHMQETACLTPDELKADFSALMDSLPLLGAEAGQARLSYFRDSMEGSRAVGTREGLRVRMRPLAYQQPERWMEESLERMALSPIHAENRFAPMLVNYDPYGVHFIDSILGANVYFKDGQWNAEYLKTPVGELQFPDLEKSGTWALARRAAAAFLAAGVKLPLFAMPTLSSALNILVNLYGQEGLIAMMEDEEAARHDLTVINDLIRALHRWYREHIPMDQLQAVVSDGRAQPPGAGQLCGCTTQLLSGSMYRDWILPLDDALLGDYPRGGMIHLCGAHAQHIPNFRAMPHLRCVQVNDRACRDLEAYLTGLREDQIVYYCPCPEMPLEKALSISGGKRLVVVTADAVPLPVRRNTEATI